MCIHALWIAVKVKLVDAQASVGWSDKITLQRVFHQEHMTGVGFAGGGVSQLPAAPVVLRVTHARIPRP